jgi:SAM-dependent methyltransferase
MTTRGDYVLGSHDAEIERLGFQHGQWRDLVHDAWHRAGIGAGQWVVDVGAGPGFATYDLAAIVGAAGGVTAVERSHRYLEHLHARAARAGAAARIAVHEHDLMLTPIPRAGSADGLHDAAWCRWVAMFVPSVPTLVERIRSTLRPGGVAVFHEYAHYRTYGAQPPRQGITDFVEAAIASFRDSGGDPDAAGPVLRALHAGGFRVREVRPIVRAARPGQPLWDWPAGFIRTYVPRLRELGRVDEAWCARALADLAAAERDPDSVLLTPMVLEIVAERRD